MFETITRQHLEARQLSEGEEADFPSGAIRDADVLLDHEPTADERAIARDLINNLLQGLEQSCSRIALLLAVEYFERAILQCIMEEAIQTPQWWVDLLPKVTAVAPPIDAVQRVLDDVFADLERQGQLLDGADGVRLLLSSRSKTQAHHQDQSP